MGGEDSEEDDNEDERELSRIEQQLAFYTTDEISTMSVHFPNLLTFSTATSVPVTPVLSTQELHQITIFIDRVKLPEIVFEPRLIGVDECGLTEAIRRSLNSFTVEQATALCKVSKERVHHGLSAVARRDRVLFLISLFDVYDAWSLCRTFTSLAATHCIRISMHACSARSCLFDHSPQWCKSSEQRKCNVAFLCVRSQHQS